MFSHHEMMHIYDCLRECVLGCSSHVQPFATLWTVACHATVYSVHEILQARIVQWVTMPSSGGPSRPRGQACVSYISCTGRRVLASATWEAPRYVVDVIFLWEKMEWENRCTYLAVYKVAM